METYLFYFLIYPGFLFAAVIGAFLSWFDRKITARVQFRKGPPLLQPFYDFFKLLLVKETILPARGAKGVFLAAPVFAVFGATMAGVFILLPLMNITTGFHGDTHPVGTYCFNSAWNVDRSVYGAFFVVCSKDGFVCIIKVTIVIEVNPYPPEILVFVIKRNKCNIVRGAGCENKAW